MRKKREYLRILDKAIPAMESAIDSFNRVKHPYRDETTLLLISNSWELLAKAVLVKKKISIETNKENSISAAEAISKLTHNNVLATNQADLIQQIISLRNFAAHYILPEIPKEIMHHLLYFGCKFFREIIQKEFPTKVEKLEENYLSLSFSNLTTYADKVQKLVSKIKKNEDSKKLVWLLERGIKFDGTNYISQTQFEQQYKKKRRIMPHLEISDFIKNSEMVRIVAVQAPKNYTADISLRKGSPNDSSLPVQIKKTDLEVDYPYLTIELADKLNKNSNFVAHMTKCLGLKGDPRYHQSIRSSKKNNLQRYSQAALDRMQQHLANDPGFNPYKPLKSGNI